MKKPPSSPRPAFNAAAPQPPLTPTFNKAAANPKNPKAPKPQHNLKPPTFARGGAGTANAPAPAAAPSKKAGAKQTPKQAFAQAAAQKQALTKTNKATLTQKFNKAVKR